MATPRTVPILDSAKERRTRRRHVVVYVLETDWVSAKGKSILEQAHNATDAAMTFNAQAAVAVLESTGCDPASGVRFIKSIRLTYDPAINEKGIDITV